MPIMVLASITHKIDHVGDAQFCEIYRMVLRGIQKNSYKFSKIKRQNYNFNGERGHYASKRTNSRKKFYTKRFVERTTPNYAHMVFVELYLDMLHVSIIFHHPIIKIVLRSQKIKNNRIPQ